MRDEFNGPGAGEVGGDEGGVVAGGRILEGPEGCEWGVVVLVGMLATERTREGGRRYGGEAGGNEGGVVGELLAVEFDVAIVVRHGAGIVPDTQFQGGLRDCRRGGGGSGQQREEDGKDGELHRGVYGERMGRWWSDDDVGVEREIYI